MDVDLAEPRLRGALDLAFIDRLGRRAARADAYVGDGAFAFGVEGARHRLALLWRGLAITQRCLEAGFRFVEFLESHLSAAKLKPEIGHVGTCGGVAQHKGFGFREPFVLVGRARLDKVRIGRVDAERAGRNWNGLAFAQRWKSLCRLLLL